jgi:Glycosyl hydrolases family 39
MRRHSVPVSRQTFLKGMAGMAVAAGTRNLWTGRSPAHRRPAHPHSDQSANVTVDLSSATGKTIQPDLYGYATGALLDNDFQLAANKVVESSAETLSPALIRFNTPVQTIIQSVFAAGASQPDWAPFSHWVQHHGDFLSDPGRLIFGIGPAGDDTSIPPATWAKYAGATARHFREIGQEITCWEVGNECDPMGATGYSHYFNAIADALHAVNPGYLVGGPVASWWNGIDLPGFISHSGAKLGFIDFHSYPVNGTDSTQTAYEKAATFADVMNARQAVAGTVAANLPIGLLEYNMNGDEQPDGSYGLPAQGTIVGAVYVALLLTQAFASDPGFTMAALWDLVADSNYGAIGNAQDKTSYRAIDEQGWYLRQAAQLMPGQQVLATTTAADLQVLATTSGQSFSLQLVNYQLSQQQSATITITGGTPSSPLTRWELSERYPTGHLSTTATLTRVPLPPQSIVILNGSTTTAGGAGRR